MRAAMTLADLRRLACPACGRAHDLLLLLDAAAGALRAGPWARAACPACGAGAHLELAAESAAIGRLADEPRPRFEPHQRVRQPGLRVRSTPEALVVELLHRRWALARRE
jgi:hypothetical protein